MTDTRIQVPDGMLSASWQAVKAKMSERHDAGFSGSVDVVDVARIAIEAALRWLDDEVEKLEFCSDDYKNFRRLFTKLGPKEVLIDLLYEGAEGVNHNSMILEAYRRGIQFAKDARSREPELKKDLLR